MFEIHVSKLIKDQTHIMYTLLRMYGNGLKKIITLARYTI